MDGEKGIVRLIVEALIPMKQDFYIWKYYIANNRIFFVWIIGYFLLFWSIEGFMIDSFFWLLILYYLSIKIALSEFGEMIIRALNDARPLAMSKEKNRLMNLYSEVYERALERSKHLEKDINIYIVDDLTPNSFAIGRKSVVVTKGLFDLMTDEEIKGILAHEFAHIANGDTVINIIFQLGNTVFTVIFIIVRTIIINVQNSQQRFMGSWILDLVNAIMGAILLLLNILAVALLMINAREREYKCDMYSYELGYGNSLITSFYKLYDYTTSRPKNIVERLLQSHPRLPYRIGKLEEQLKEQLIINNE